MMHRTADLTDRPLLECHSMSAGVGHNKKRQYDCAIIDFTRAIKPDPSHQHAKGNLKKLGVKP